MTIRWATPADRPAVIALMREAKTGCSWLDYGDMDGTAFVDEGSDGRLRGYVRFHLGRPEVYVRQLVVRPDLQGHGTVARRLLLSLVDVSREYGAQVIEAFQHADEGKVIEQTMRLCASVDPGVRVRMPLAWAVERWRRVPNSETCPKGGTEGADAR